MNDTLKKYIDPVIKLWGRQTKRNKVIFGSVLGAVVAVAFIISLFLNRTQYTVLYPGLDRGEVIEIADELNKREVSYREKDGTIYVPKEEEASLRMEFANMGYPKTTMNYDYFTNNVDIMSTDYEKKVIEKYQLNQRLEAVVETLEPIKNATVIISIPDDGGYAWDENRAEPSASVAVEIAPGKSLEPNQVNGIKQLVAKSVPSLKPEEVVVIDTATGDELQSSDSVTQTNVSKFKLEIEQQYESDIRKKVLNMLAPIYGEKNVNVAVKAIMDIDKKIREITTYEPSQDNRGVVSEETQSHEQQQGGENAGGVAGAETNADVTNYPGITVDENTIYVKDDNSYKYLVNEIKQQIQGDAASVSDMTIAVAINRDSIDDGNKEELRNLIASAAAVTPDKVAIYAGAFYEPEQESAGENPSENPALSTVQLLIAAGAVFIFLLLLLIILRRRRRKKKAAGASDAALTENPDAAFGFGPKNGQLDAEFINSLKNAEATKEEKLKQEIQEFSSGNPEISAQLIRSWLKGEDLNA